MVRYRFNPVALVFGLVFATAGVIVLSGGELIDDGRPLIPAGLIALGVALLVQVGRRTRTGDSGPTVPEPAVVESTSVGATVEADEPDSDPTRIERTPSEPEVSESEGVDPTLTIDPTESYDDLDRPDRPDRPD